ncbi:MAG TPA: methionine--tRNA ligase, partial [Patescibacteria group bacterium]
KYKGLYCVGCELFYTSSELNENGQCFEHPGKKLEEVEEENYFFKLSQYKDQLIKLIKAEQLIIVPNSRKNEVLAFLQEDLQDISISRSNTRAKNWGVEIPNDNTQRMYVWFDALNIYQSGVGFGTDDKKYQKWWPADVHAIGKGIIRFHAIYWPAFLLSAGLALPKKLFVHEYITVNGQKMSKTLGNIIDPFALINKYGSEAVRYYFLRYISPFVDGDFSEEKFQQVYNADLANGLGNLIARVAKLCENANYVQMGSVDRVSEHFIADSPYTQALHDFKFPDAVAFIWQQIADLDRYINDEKPWILAKTDLDRLKSVLAHCVDRIQEIAILLKPFMPQTAEKILQQFSKPKIISEKPLFPRI